MENDIFESLENDQLLKNKYYDLNIDELKQELIQLAQEPTFIQFENRLNKIIRNILRSNYNIYTHHFKIVEKIISKYPNIPFYKSNSDNIKIDDTFIEIFNNARKTIIQQFIAEDNKLFKQIFLEKLYPQTLLNNIAHALGTMSKYNDFSDWITKYSNFILSSVSNGVSKYQNNQKKIQQLQHEDEQEKTKNTKKYMDLNYYRFSMPGDDITMDNSINELLRLNNNITKFTVINDTYFEENDNINTVIKNFIKKEHENITYVSQGVICNIENNWKLVFIESRGPANDSNYYDFSPNNENKYLSYSLYALDKTLSAAILINGSNTEKIYSTIMSEIETLYDVFALNKETIEKKLKSMTDHKKISIIRQYIQLSDQAIKATTVYLNKHYSSSIKPMQIVKYLKPLTHYFEYIKREMESLNEEVSNPDISQLINTIKKNISQNNIRIFIQTDKPWTGKRIHTVANKKATLFK